MRIANQIIVLPLLLFLLIESIHVHAQDPHALKSHYKLQAENTCVNLWKDGTHSARQIVLIRHGEPDLNKKGWRNREEARQFMKDYDSVGVRAFAVLPLCLETVHADSIHHSPVPRAAHTAQLAFKGFPLKGDIRFREFERKTMNFWNIKMPLKFWTGGSRVLWMLGMNKKGIESFRESKSRAFDNATFLVSESESNEIVILVAHGLHNKFVKKYLRKMGWKKVYDEGNGYLSVKILAISEN